MRHSAAMSYDTEDDLIPSQAGTLNQDHLIKIDNFDVASQILASSIRQLNCLNHIQNLHLYCQ